MRGPVRRSAIGPNELVKRVRLGELAGRDQLGHDRVEGGAEEGVAGRVEDDERDEVPELQRSRQGESGDGAHGQRADQVGGRASCRRRSKRSLRTPPRRRSASVGTVIATPTMARAVGALESA